MRSESQGFRRKRRREEKKENRREKNGLLDAGGDSVRKPGRRGRRRAKKAREGPESAAHEKTPTSSKHSNQAASRDCGLRRLPGCTFSFWRLADQWLRHDWSAKPIRKTHLCFRYSGTELGRRADTKDGGEIGRAPALAGPPRLFVRRNWPPGGRIGHSKQSNQVPF